MPFGAINNGWKRHHYVECGFIAALLVICVALTTLQNRWTTSLGRATTRQQTTQIRVQMERLCNAFDAEINEACLQLRPDAQQIETLGREEAHARALLRWQGGRPRPLFRRLAVTVAEAGRAQLYLLDQQSAKLTRSEWPPEWDALRRNLSLRAMGRLPQPFMDPSGVLREYPIFGRRGPGRPGRPGEIEWAIMELDLTYAKKTWLPALVREFLNPDQDILDDVLVETTGSPPEVIFSTGDRRMPSRGDVVSLDFNSKARGGREDTDTERDDFWTIRVWPRSGKFAAAVSGARRRDFAVACMLDLLLLIGGLLLVRYARRARRLGDARLKFVAAVSHELRTPLTVILAAAQTLRRGIVPDPERYDKYTGMIVDHSKQLAEMVEQVLAFAGAKRNESVLVRKPVVVAEVLRDAIAACAPETQAAHCDVETHVEPDLPPVLGDTLALQRVFRNLLSNAVKHGGDGKWIGVSTRHLKDTQPGCVEVEVCDHGAGIPPGEQSHVFEPFFRGARANDLQIRGSGIGLSVVQEIVQVHRGTVRVESRLGKGTTFTVRLPVAEDVTNVVMLPS